MRRWAGWICVTVLSGVFLYAGALKIAQPRAFQEAILDHQLIGLAPAALLAWWLPWFEVLCAGVLWWPRWRGAALLGITGLVVVFLIVITISLARGLAISCGCFGLDGHGLWLALATDLVLLGACGGALAGLRSAAKR